LLASVPSCRRSYQLLGPSNSCVSWL
jgi:hypothetical protein